MGTLADDIHAFIAKKRHVTFVELCRLPGVRGDQVMTAGPNLVLWPSLTTGAATALIDLIVARRIFMMPATLLVYAVDGADLQLPIAKRVTPAGYAKPHWLPVTFDIYPLGAGRMVAAG